MPTELDDEKKIDDVEVFTHDVPAITARTGYVTYSTHRGLRMRHLQLIAISGAIGSSVFLSIGNPLTGGPLPLLIGVSLWASVVWALSNCLLEMCTLLPLDGGFIHFATRFLDPAMGFSLGWNYFICQAALICSELTALYVIVAYWAPDLNPAILISVGLALLFFVQVFNVRIYGETEFWISIGKVFMIIGVFIFTFITMLGGNPIHDRYGFRYWKHPGPFAATDATGRAYAIWKALQWGAYGIVGPDYISLVAGEVKNPRRILPKAFNSTIYRIITFYVGGAFFAGLQVASDNPDLLGASGSGAVKSPYIINMTRLHVPILPSIISAGLLISLFSSTSSMAFAASRTLYGLGLQGHAPKIVTRVNRQGLPYVCVLITIALGTLSYMALGTGSKKGEPSSVARAVYQADITVLNWLINLTAATQLITWMAIAGSYIRFRAGMKAQGISRDILPAKSRFQPWSAWYGLFWALFALVFSGYYFFAPGSFDVPDFLFTYGAVFIFIALFIVWKIKGVRHHEQLLGIPTNDMDFKTGLQEIEEMTLQAEEEWATQKRNVLDRVVDKLF
ncbi:amino acid permease/ SLC12A domain-containing protein [Naematelia encephala]|uniref:Amino acid permease/ SLC12A domain-containing protein n=1 Tax=Naematelia encephala TaxID=71784 RepID=A0A1Y2B282_9TREE|nr:amino acid permease/ SLC12A domain-containing protein [Naematelia encephala]